MRRLLAVLTVWAGLATALAAEVSEPDGFRGPPYHGAVPRSLEGATVLDDMEAPALWREGHAVFIDVLPHHPRPPGLGADQVWIERPRHSIPGAIWLPDIGHHVLSEEEAAYFRAGLSAASQSETERALVFFCLAECWMSWNAARRALIEGYKRVYWYPDGSDGWAAQGWPLEQVTPWRP